MGEVVGQITPKCEERVRGSRAVCRCGWKGEERAHPFLARLDARRHAGTRLAA